MADLDEIRAKAERHEEELQQHRLFLTTGDLCRRWGVSDKTVAGIPPNELPYLNLGRGLHKMLRRYRLADVEAYEAALIQARAG